MRIIVFDQWEKLVALLRNVAAGSATGTTTVVMPDMVPGKARDFMLRVTASGENEIVFSGAEAFEGEEGALEPPGDGETVVYFFTETSSDVLLVARKAVERIET